MRRGHRVSSWLLLHKQEADTAQGHGHPWPHGRIFYLKPRRCSRNMNYYRTFIGIVSARWGASLGPKGNKEDISLWSLSFSILSSVLRMFMHHPMPPSSVLSSLLGFQMWYNSKHQPKTSVLHISVEINANEEADMDLRTKSETISMPSYLTLHYCSSSIQYWWKRKKCQHCLDWSFILTCPTLNHHCSLWTVEWMKQQFRIQLFSGNQETELSLQSHKIKTFTLHVHKPDRIFRYPVILQGCLLCVFW